MLMAQGTYGSGQSNTVLVAGQPGRVIRVVKLLITSWAALRVQVVSNPGPEADALLGPVHVGAGQTLELRLGRGLALAAGRGAAVGITTAFQGGAGEFTVIAWYEVVS